MRARLLLALAISTLLAACGVEHRASDDSSLRISSAVIAEPVLGERAALYITVTNEGDADDELLAVSSSVAEGAEIHRTETRDGMSTMKRITSLAVAAGQTVALEPGGHHVMLEGLRERLEPGDLVHVELDFRYAGRVAVRARVVAYTDLEEALDLQGGQPHRQRPH